MHNVTLMHHYGEPSLTQSPSLHVTLIHILLHVALMHHHHGEPSITQSPSLHVALMHIIIINGEPSLTQSPSDSQLTCFSILIHRDVISRSMRSLQTSSIPSALVRSLSIVVCVKTRDAATRTFRSIQRNFST